jgi:hypothetical protein
MTLHEWKPRYGLFPFPHAAIRHEPDSVANLKEHGIRKVDSYLSRRHNTRGG